MTITARFASTCGGCGTRIAVGTRVNWTPGQPAAHERCPENTAPVARLPVEDAGVYILPDGSIAKVKANQTKTRTYALRWVPDAGINRIDANGERATGNYVFEAGLVQQVAAEGRKMTLDEAKAFTLQYGECVRCGRTLTDPTSIERAMGPVCVRYFR